MEITDPPEINQTQEIPTAVKVCEYCQHGESKGILAGAPVVCMIHGKTMPASHTCERWEIISLPK